MLEWISRCQEVEWDTDEIVVPVRISLVPFIEKVFGENLLISYIEEISLLRDFLYRSSIEMVWKAFYYEMI